MMVFLISERRTIMYNGNVRNVIVRLHYVPGGHGGHVSNNREQNGTTVRQRRGTR